jgi:hypothetical protein
MKKNIKRAIVGTVAGAAIAIAGAGTANADDASGFLTAVSVEGLYSTGPNPTGNLLAHGYWVCTALANNSAVDVAEEVYWRTNKSVSPRNAVALVAAAVVYLCPAYYNTVVDQPGVAPAPSYAPSAPNDTTV